MWKNSWLLITTLLLLILWHFNPSIPFIVVFMPLALVFLPSLLLIVLIAIILSMIGSWLLVIVVVFILMLIVEWIKGKL
jgi:hypothetical protein